MAGYHHTLPTGEQIALHWLTPDNFDIWQLEVIIAARKFGALDMLRGRPIPGLRLEDVLTLQRHLIVIILSTISPMITLLKRHGFDVYEADPYIIFGSIETIMKEVMTPKNANCTCDNQRGN